MSHLSKCETKLTNKRRVNSLAKQRGWTIEEVDNYTNPYSREVVKKATVLRDKFGVKMALNQQGEVFVDPYYMGKDYEEFMQDYATGHIKSAAFADGGVVTSQRVDQKTGDVLLEVEYY
jgi:hypothetical protein